VNEQRTRLFGLVAALGGIMSVLVSVPGQWYGVPQTDSYVFHPDPFTPLWIQRAVVPGLIAVVTVFLVAGLLGLVLRDRPVAGRWRRLGGVGAVIGLTFLALSVVGLTYLSTGSGATQGTTVDLLSLALGGIGLLVFVPSLVALIVGYVLTARPYPGYALGGAAILTPYLSYIGLETIGRLVAMLPVGAAWVAVGIELWTHPEAVPPRDDESQET